MVVDILIPAFNESLNLMRIENELLPQLKRDSIDYRIILVNDGSSDDTGAIADNMAQRIDDITVIHHSRNKGLGAALRTGYAAAKNDWIITIDADFSYSPDQIRNLVHSLSPNIDAVFGSPYMPGGRVIGVSTARLIPSKCVSVIYSFVHRRWLYCWTGIFRAIRRNEIQRISIVQNGFDAVAEIAIKLSKNECRILEIPATLGRRVHGQSKSSLSREIFRHIKQIIGSIS